jgi:glutamine amidotransferase
MITIVDYGVGNLLSIVNMFRKIGVEARLSCNIDEISGADKLLIPGVGNFGHGMAMLRNNGFVEVLNDVVLSKKKPVLGICLGMQLLLEGSEEAPGVAGLGWISGQNKRFVLPSDSQLKVPHMGWSDVSATRSSPLFKGFEDEARFYFVHSYHAVPTHVQNVLLTSHYGYEFACGIRQEHIFGVQFHPEKSHRFGMQLLKNFSEI